MCLVLNELNISTFYTLVDNYFTETLKIHHINRKSLVTLKKS